ncbi:uncharacterized protein LOC132061852 [Lycium ferocissimum]|uniref:uncharacterized protein LOC132061852 n=1 Tax=Lycium ferocissimum TaxID=112874 RepID=UPI00281528CE|nr:uncharacterized protein LOC132061852 [Lycium ferocissimum]
MGSLGIQFSQMGFLQISRTQLNYTVSMRKQQKTTVCGLRNGPRKPMWRSRVLSSEAIQAVQSLKLAATSPHKLEEMLENKLSRLLKADVLDTLTELQRQNQLHLALKGSGVQLCQERGVVHTRYICVQWYDNDAGQKQIH